MTDPNDNAFPMVVAETCREARNGLTKRELFAVLIYACGENEMTADRATNCADILIKSLNSDQTT